MNPLINLPIQPTIHTSTHRWGCLYRFQIFKFKFYYILTDLVDTPLRVVWVDMGGCGGVPCIHTCVHTHTCLLHHRVSPRGSNLHEIIMFSMHACAYVHVCVCVCMYGTPLTPSPNPYPLSPPTPKVGTP